MKKEKVIEYFLQLVMVVVGVFLGMLASNWNANKALEQNKLDILISLKSEIKNNLDYLERRKRLDIKPFFNTLDSISKALDTQPDILKQAFKEQPFSERIPNFPGLGRPKLDHAMYDVAKFSNTMPNYNLQLLTQVTKTYNQQFSLDEIRKTFEREFFAIDAYTRYDDVLDLMWGIMQDYFGGQYSLIEEYKKTLDLIEQTIQ